MRKIGNPTWTRNELILALDLYLSHRDNLPGKASDEIRGLSKLLRNMAEKFYIDDNTTYRNTNGVYMKLMNFKALDPDYTKNGKVGLTRVGKHDKQVWAEFWNASKKCAIAAQEIREAINAKTPI